MTRGDCVAETVLPERSDPSSTEEAGDEAADPIAETAVGALLVKIKPMVLDPMLKWLVPSRRLGL